MAYIQYVEKSETCKHFAARTAALQWIKENCKHVKWHIGVTDAEFRRKLSCSLKRFSVSTDCCHNTESRCHKSLFQTSVKITPPVPAKHLFSIQWLLHSVGHCGHCQSSASVPSRLPADTKLQQPTAVWSPNNCPVDYRIWGFCCSKSTAVRSLTSTVWKNYWLKSGTTISY